ncbi:MAG: BREX-1 system adenine-specific DNA-methyltransferase PglX [Bacteroidales bacterium]|nr:BREX-1 system adenine-specific DNA-methyltransferase PglX [Bacteroidales bacterium]
MTNPSRHTEWLSLVEVSGPFLALPVLEKAFPQGLDVVETPKRQRLRAAYEEWTDAVEGNDPLLSDLHREWIRLVFTEILEYDASTLATDAEKARTYLVASPDRNETFAPDWVVVSPSNGEPRLFVSVQPPGTDFERIRKDDGWPASLLERMVALCRSQAVRLGVITDGERWMLVNAPVGGTSSYVSWYARLWFQEPITLKAFQSLWSVRRCFGPSDETLEALLDRSLEHHEEITDTLGEQVRRAVEVLVQCLDKADADRNRELLRDVSPAELYEAGLTVMMRLVFVLCAEERGLLLSGDPVYDECYAVSTLRAQLAEEADRHGPEVLDRRHDAWARLLSVFRAVHGGIDHESLRMPALGGSLFDPDRFPFLEGRSKGTSWRDSDAAPLPIDNRTVLLLLGSLQLLEQHGGALLLSYRALDVEQIGHVYEGLLEHTVARMPSVTIGLTGSKKAKNPNFPLSELESAHMDGEDTLVALVKETTERSESAIRNALARPVDETVFGRLLAVCGGDTTLAERILPFANLLRTDAWGDPIVYREGAFMVTLGADRRETGTHYTPKSLTESIVETTLQPVAYVGPAEGKPREEWRLKTPAELLELKICDPAMGSGAFLVQACRWLAERLVEAWAKEEAAGKFVTADGEVLDRAGGSDPMPDDLDERLLAARRLIAERCLYGVDVNPLAVELAKLSIWLVTLAKGRPFGFLDHNLRCGDSLLGIHRLDQLTKLKLNPDDGPYQERIFGQNVAGAVAEAVEIRKRLRTIPIRDVRDVETMARLDVEARKKLQSIELVADAMIGEVLRANGNARAIESAMDSLAMQADIFLKGDEKMGRTIARQTRAALSVDSPDGKPARKPFHWSLEFPEVFQRENSGFDAIVGNPPFMGGKRISSAFGTFYNTYLSVIHPPASKNTDLCAHFYRRSYSLIRRNGHFGLLAVNTIAEGDTRQGGLEWIISKNGVIHAAFPNEPWPGKAAVVTSRAHIRKGYWQGIKTLGDLHVAFISAFLSDQDDWTPKPLRANKGKAFQGSIIIGMGFILSHAEALGMIESNPINADVILPYINGEDLNADPEQRASRWVINFWDWPEERAEKYREPYAWIRARVFPERLEKSKSKSYQRIMSMWWQHWNARPAMYHAIGRGRQFINHPRWWRSDREPMPRVLILSRVSKTGGFVLVDNNMVFADQTIVFAMGTNYDFAVMQSSIHIVWAWKQSSRLKQDMRYTPTDVLETFPFPLAADRGLLDGLGDKYHTVRSAIMREHQVGLTKLYSWFHDPSKEDQSISILRDMHSRIDNAVALAYGWDDLDLGHGFHEVPYLPENDRVRFTISEAARLEVLKRLAHLNRERYEWENSGRSNG